MYILDGLGMENFAIIHRHLAIWYTLWPFGILYMVLCRNAERQNAEHRNAERQNAEQRNAKFGINAGIPND
jgi:hypothetical protein